MSCLSYTLETNNKFTSETTPLISTKLTVAELKINSQMKNLNLNTLMPLLIAGQLHHMNKRTQTNRLTFCSPTREFILNENKRA